MRIQGKNTQSIIEHTSQAMVQILDQTKLPYQIAWLEIHTIEQVAHAIKTMQIRGAPLIGALAAYGLAMAMRINPSDKHLKASKLMLASTRPTAVNLIWALNRVEQAIANIAPNDRYTVAWQEASNIKTQDVEINRAIGLHGLELFKQIWKNKKQKSTLNILTHCNAGWLATVDYGTATSPMYLAHDQGMPIHVYVDETRPRNQGALTAFELSEHGIPNTLIVDNAGGQLMQNGKIDLVIVGCDRVAANGDVCNKIGTYLKALAALDNNIPFYVALPSPTIDLSTPSGSSIPIEERNADEVRHVYGLHQNELSCIAIYSEQTSVSNLAFDVTPARLVSALITEKGIMKPSELTRHFSPN